MVVSVGVGDGRVVVDLWLFFFFFFVIGYIILL